MSLTDLIQHLESYNPSSDLEKEHRDNTITLIKEHGEKCLYRDLFEPGHITGSALLISADRVRILMNKHKASGVWINFGGHVDGEAHILNAAKREVIEESGIEHITPFSEEIIDIDVHPVPKRPEKKEPAHHHFDIRYLFKVTEAQYENFEISEESTDLKWCTYEEACALANPSRFAMRRYLQKTYEFLR